MRPQKNHLRRDAFRRAGLAVTRKRVNLRDETPLSFGQAARVLHRGRQLVAWRVLLLLLHPSTAGRVGTRRARQGRLQRLRYS